MAWEGWLSLAILAASPGSERALASLSALHNEVRWSIEAGDLARARQVCERILAIRPDNLQTLLLLGEVDLEERNYRAASVEFERVLHGDPEAYLAYAGLGIAYDHLSNAAGAVAWYTRALDLNPANAEIRRERDRLYEIAFPGRLIPSGMSRFSLGRSLFQSGFRNEGVARFKSALASHPGRTEIRLGLAEALWAMAKSSAARDLCQQIVQTEPRVVKANALLACIAAEAGDVSQGRELLADVHAQDPVGHIAGDIILQSPLADLAMVDVDISVDLDDRTGREPEQDTPSDATTWIRWMRDALWTALRLIKPAVDEIAVTRAAWARIAPYLGDDQGSQVTTPESNAAPSGYVRSGASSQPGPEYVAGGRQAPAENARPSAPARAPEDSQDRTEIIYPHHRRADDRR
jgi:tetratricopeptide (TPR) repeat protein